MDFNALHKQRKFMMIAAALGIIGLILPWVSLGPFGSINGLHGEGWIIFFAFAGAGVLAFLGDQKKALDKNSWLGALGAIAVAVIIILIMVIRIKFRVNLLSIGFWVTLIAIGGLAYVTLTYGDPTKSIKQSLNQMTQDVKNKFDGDPNT